MSLRGEILDRLTRNDIAFAKVDIDREADLNGLPATEVKVVTGDMREHVVTLAKKNNMSAEHIADVVLSYIMRGKKI